VVAEGISSNPAAEISHSIAMGRTSFCMLKTWRFQWRVLDCFIALKGGLKLMHHVRVKWLE